MKFPLNQKITEEGQTVDLAKEFISILQEGDVVVLNGNLGAGKTFFVKSCLKNEGISTVNSPTFALVNEYENRKKYYHFDFYRINYLEELYDIGFNDYINDLDAVSFIEWGDLYPEVLPSKRYEIKITLMEDFSRIFNIAKYE